MGSNGTAKKRSMAHYLHKQWVKTDAGGKAHKKQVQIEKEKRNETSSN